MDGVFNVKDNLPPGKIEVQIKIRPEAEIYGLTQQDVLGQIRGGFFGQEAQRLIIGVDEVKIWVRYPKEERSTLDDLKNIKIKTINGLAIPLDQICDLELGRAPESLKRRNGQRIIVVDAECEDPDLVAKINTVITDSILWKVKQVSLTFKLSDRDLNRAKNTRFDAISCLNRGSNYVYNSNIVL